MHSKDVELELDELLELELELDELLELELELDELLDDDASQQQKPIPIPIIHLNTLKTGDNPRTA